MPIPDHVRRQAMDAVSHYETTHQIRAFRDSGMDASFAPPPLHSEPVQAYQPLTEDVRRQALDAVAEFEMRGQIRLVRDNGEVMPPVTPLRENERIAQKISGLHRSGMDAETVQRTITKDGFGREL